MAVYFKKPVSSFPACLMQLLYQDVCVTVKQQVMLCCRLNALKKSGEEDWRRRVPKTLDLDTPVKLRDKTNLAGVERPSSLADRLKNLDESKGGWKERVEEKDQEQFTVKGRLGRGRYRGREW